MLPIDQYPQITPPVVKISASYPGASALTVSQAVATPIEQELNGTPGMLYMESSSSNSGGFSATVTFDISANPDLAAVEIQNRIKLAESRLPTEVVQNGISVEKQAASQLLTLCLTSTDPKFDEIYLSNFATLNVVDLLRRIPGVGRVSNIGSRYYAMQIWVQPDKLANLGITVADLQKALKDQNRESAAGVLGQQPVTGLDVTIPITTQGRLSSVSQFEEIVVRANPDGSIIRLRDVARISLEAQSYNTESGINGENAAVLAVYMLPGANAMEVADKVKAAMADISKNFPDGLSYRIPFDMTTYISESIHEVYKTLFEALALVIFVVFLSLQSWRATLIPLIAVPISLIGTFGFMLIFGFSLNILTLLGLVLAIGIVVDDAIVVVENVERIMDEEHLPPYEATQKAMKSLTSPIIATSLVLAAVFVPVSFLGGITGQLYKQFALTIAVSTAFSGFNALTLTPALCALFLTPRNKNTKNVIYKVFNKGYNAVEAFYKRVVGHALNHAKLAILAFVIVAVIGIIAFLKWPTSYIPQEDQGYFMSSIQLPQGASLERTEKVVNSLSDEIRRRLPEVSDVMSISGFSFLGGGASSNMGSLVVVLKPWKERKSKSQSVFAIIDSVRNIADSYQEAIVFSVNPPTIPGLGMSSGLEMQLLDINNLGAAEMMKAIASIQEAAKDEPRISSITTMYQGEVPQYRLNIDRDRVKLQGLTMSDVFSTLAYYMGGSYVNDFVEFGRVYQVTLKGDDSARGNIEDVMKLSVRNSGGEMVPFASFTTIESVMGQPTASRYNMYATAAITANVAHGVSSSDGIKAMEQLVKKTLGNNYSYAWTGEAYQETQSGTTVTAVFLFAIILTLLVLAAQYESWTDPIAVVLSMPIAILGTVLGCMFMSQSISIYTQIGLILLLGLSAKNAILIVEYATYFRKGGVTIKQAALDAGVIRFRPIMMTAIAFILGVMPMMFATGAGAESRVSLGTAVVFGMLLNAILGTLFVPNFWDMMQTFQEKVLSKFFKGVDDVPAQSSDDIPKGSI